MGKVALRHMQTAKDLRCMDTSHIFLPFSQKETVFAASRKRNLAKRVYSKKNCSQRSKFFPLRKDLLGKEGKMKMADL